MRLRILAVLAVAMLVGVVAGVITLVRNDHSDALPPPAQTSPAFQTYVQKQAPQVAVVALPASPSPTALGPLVARLNTAWAGYFDNAFGKPVVATTGMGSAGVALMAPDDSLYPLCAGEQMFDADGNTIMYCIAPPTVLHGENPHSGNILVPNAPFVAALQKVAATDAAQANTDAALVTAFFYTYHLQTNLRYFGLASWEPLTWAHWCMAGVSMGVLATPRPPDGQFLGALWFLHQFWQGPNVGFQLSALLKGYQARNPRDCFPT